MNKDFFLKLEERVSKVGSLVCVGLDPHKMQLKNADLESMLQFCLNIISATHSYAAAYKPNSAYFECFGSEGVKILCDVIKAIPDDIPVILDNKRGDIDTTAQAYASAAYECSGADSVTLSPYMGFDSIKPFISGAFGHKAVWVLCKTSNPSSQELQEEMLRNGDTVYMKVAQLCRQWNDRQHTQSGHGAVGLVAGATDATALNLVRGQDPNIWILCPGVGAQGGDLQAACLAGLRMDGSGLLVSVSRAISSAEDMGAAARQLRDQVNLCRNQKMRQTLSQPVEGVEAVLQPHQRDFIALAVSSRALQLGSFTLKSGRVSPYFFNAGLLCNGATLTGVGRSYAKMIHDSGVDCDVLFGPAYKGIPIAAAVAVAYWEMFGEAKEVAFNRKEAKDHGEGGLLVGAQVAGRRVLVIDDVITAGTAVREAMDTLRSAGAVVVGVCVCLDRQERTSDSSPPMSAVKEVEEEFGVPVLSVVTLTNLIQFLRNDNSNSILMEKREEMEAYRAFYGV